MRKNKVEKTIEKWLKENDYEYKEKNKNWKIYKKKKKEKKDL